MLKIRLNKKNHIRLRVAGTGHILGTIIPPLDWPNVGYMIAFDFPREIAIERIDPTTGDIKGGQIPGIQKSTK